MNKKLFILALLLIVLGFLVGYYSRNVLFTKLGGKGVKSNNLTSDLRSLYAGQEVRGIKSLSQADIEGLLRGEGTPFGGMAKLAELSGYPGPRHVLDMVDELDLSNLQKSQIEKLYEDMRDGAIKLGEQIITIEDELDNKFVDKSITENTLYKGVIESGSIYSDLRFLHLKYHLAMVDILTDEQIEKYNNLRGYTSTGDPCGSVPEGHDATMWKLHHNCE